MNDNKKEKIGLLGKPGTASRVANVGCLITIVPFICFVIWMGTSQLNAMKAKEAQWAATSNLLNLVDACTTYWETDPEGICLLPESRKKQSEWGLTFEKMEISIVNGRKENFKAMVKHEKLDKVFHGDKDKKIHLQVNDCILENRLAFLLLSNAEFEKECK